jgi:hypothetical protein
MVHRMRQLLGVRFEELAGAQASGAFPLTERVINALISDRLRESNGPVESVEVRVRPDGELLVRLRVRRPAFAPAVTIAAKIEQQPDLPRSPVVGLRWWLPGLGRLASLAGSALGFLKTPPPGVVIDGDRVRVDLAELLSHHGAAEALNFLTSLRLDTRDGAVIVRFSGGVS